MASVSSTMSRCSAFKASVLAPNFQAFSRASWNVTLSIFASRHLMAWACESMRLLCSPMVDQPFQVVSHSRIEPQLLETLPRLDGVDPDHRSSSRIQAAHSAAAAQGQLKWIAIAPQRSSMWMSAGAGAAGGKPSGTKAIGAAALAVVTHRRPKQSRHNCETKVVTPPLKTKADRPKPSNDEGFQGLRSNGVTLQSMPSQRSKVVTAFLMV